jgi:hypothetical protein
VAKNIPIIPTQTPSPPPGWTPLSSQTHIIPAATQPSTNPLQEGLRECQNDLSCFPELVQNLQEYIREKLAQAVKEAETSSPSDQLGHSDVQTIMPNDMGEESTGKYR